MKDDYDVPDMKIDSKEKLQSILEQMYCVEDCFEGMQSWIGSVLSDERSEELLSVLVEDSNAHRMELEALISKVEGVEPPEKKMDVFDIEEGADAESILRTVLENDHSALYHYALLKTQTDEDFLKKILDEKDVRDYYDSLNRLIAEEVKHIHMLKSELDLYG